MPPPRTGSVENAGTLRRAASGQYFARWATAPDEGALSVGYDCAGPGDTGDEHAWAVVRGHKCLAIIRRRGLDEDAALACWVLDRRGAERHGAQAARGGRRPFAPEVVVPDHYDAGMHIECIELDGVLVDRRRRDPVARVLFGMRVVAR